ncbi:hypothetical protein SAMN05216334_104146 [Nitrosomonas ureae]|uniref:Uncharacterized protein n=1 Tax=Nitrosomonas ureae TaxID=44577 RepID=A0A1H5TGK7_9PROT|nr:hypothetical protein SAMN05216334_104146 [Nitrosomonas ureae]
MELSESWDNQTNVLLPKNDGLQPGIINYEHRVMFYFVETKENP